MSELAARWSRATVLLVAACTFIMALSVRIIGGDGEAWRSAINSDGEGYVAYLTGLVVHGDLREADGSAQHFTPAGDDRVIQYSAGTALLQAPFYLVAHLVHHATGAQASSGLELPYQLAIVIAAWFYLTLGLFLTRSVLLAVGISDHATALSLLILALGTGLPYYTIISPAMSHVYAFAAVAWCMYEARRAWTGQRFAPERLAAALAIAMLIRPTHALIIPLLPVVALGDGRSLAHWVRHQRVFAWFRAMLIGVGLLLLQPLVWHAQCGLWWVDPYATEGFHWWQPRIWSVLFGARKGFFFYWPLMLLTIPGTWIMFRRNRLIGSLFLLNLLIIVYMTSAWWSWYYGHGYGMRPLLDLLPLLSVPIGLSLQAAPVRSTPYVTGGIVLLLGLQVFQSWQYHMGIIHPFNMDREKYGLIFLDHSAEAHGRVGWANMAQPYAPYGMEVLKESPLTDPATGSDTLRLDPAQAFSPAITLSGAELPKGRTLFVDVTVERRALVRGASNTVDLVYTLRSKGKDRAYTAYPMNDIRLDDDRTWRTWKHGFVVPPAQQGEELVVYFWQHGSGTVLIRGAHIKVSAVRDRR